MDDLTKLRLDDFLDQVADRTPTPGGGGVTGLAGALACALAHMVAAYSVNKKTDSAVRTQVETMAARLRRAGQLLRALITQDAEAYARMTEAAASRRHEPARTDGGQAAYADAVLAAAAVPMEMAAVASNALATMDEFKSIASRYILSDLAIAAVLADATARACSYTVRVNAREVSETEANARLLSNVDDILTHCVRRRESIEAFVSEHLEDGGGGGR